ncbi:PER1 precursor [Histoplasma capsulatum G186AR]|uniref:Post-GPI attachment to proteins factor 3 n=1 Tax=Ajellomyces capsulatus (strain G186AR / H82 / ATCC MYA-2454 / RMSCC 2432) TaxID=447093 RepID=C0NV41_AJECG|nr:PER1 precursor [Histoplasma capsulatum G186AR]EEH04854.1 PER1 precursor [Histoplasma capsulatum G186AR]
MTGSGRPSYWRLFVFTSLIFLIGRSSASLGDRLPDFKECVTVSLLRPICKTENCENGKTYIPFYLRLLLWDCPAECDYTCQHIITDRRVNRDPPMLEPVVQFHGKWPFYRILGMQEPFSVLFSFMNFLAHRHGMSRVRESIPHSYPMRRFYLAFGYFGLASWIFSMVFHTRDLPLTEKLDYYGAGASVLYGLYLSVVRIFRLDQTRPRQKPKLLRYWTFTCTGLFIAHVSYLSFWSWDYTYNMAANVAVGIVQNSLWTWFSISRYRKYMKSWTAWPGMIVAWIIVAMSLELLDFPPWHGLVDAHSLWHLGTVVPTAWWYSFIVRDALDDIAGERLKA